MEKLELLKKWIEKPLVRQDAIEARLDRVTWLSDHFMERNAVRAGLSGAIYTQITDVEDETNGFYTYDRAVCKLNAAHFREIAKEIKTALDECTKE